MKRHVVMALVVVGSAAALGAQQPAASLSLRLQLVSVDTAFRRTDTVATKPVKSVGGAAVQCIRPEPGQWKRADPACGPDLHNAVHTVVAEQVVTTDAQGHATKRLTWRGGDAVVEIDASELAPARNVERVHLKVAFWPDLASGDSARAPAALRASMPIPRGGLLNLTVMDNRGAMILNVEPEAARPKPAPPT